MLGKPVNVAAYIWKSLLTEGYLLPGGWKIPPDMKGFPIWRAQRAFLWRTELTLNMQQSRTALQLQATIAKACVNLNSCGGPFPPSAGDPGEINRFRRLPWVKYHNFIVFSPPLRSVGHQGKVRRNKTKMSEKKWDSPKKDVLNDRQGR